MLVKRKKKWLEQAKRWWELSKKWWELGHCPKRIKPQGHCPKRIKGNFIFREHFFQKFSRFKGKNPNQNLMGFWMDTTTQRRCKVGAWLYPQTLTYWLVQKGSLITFFCLISHYVFLINAHLFQQWRGELDNMPSWWYYRLLESMLLVGLLFVLYSDIPTVEISEICFGYSDIRQIWPTS